MLMANPYMQEVTQTLPTCSWYAHFIFFTYETFEGEIVFIYYEVHDDLQIQ